MTDESTLMPPGPPPIPGTPEANDLVVRGSDGDPVSDPRGTRMIEVESYERVIDGLKMSADACMHLAKQEPENGETWKAIGALLDRLRREAAQLAGLGVAMRQAETHGARGNPYAWRRARDRFLLGLQQSIGGMRQLATCFRGDFRWSLMAQELDRREKSFRDFLYGRKMVRPSVRLILPDGFRRH
jgi:hypothetical protein